jgi:hypothetical protein
MTAGHENSKNDVLKYRQQCKNLISISPKIRYVGILNGFGRTISGQLRQGLIPFLKADEARDEYFIEATRNRLRRNFESSIGRTEFTLTENEKVKILTMSNQSNFYYITLEKNTPANEVLQIIDSIKKMISLP